MPKIKPSAPGVREALTEHARLSTDVSNDSYLDHLELKIFRTTPFLFISAKRTP